MTSPPIVVITGASAGIARATAKQFGARGAHVGLLARGQAGLDGAAKDVANAGGRALAIPTDVADYDQVEAAAARVEETFGPIDVWINIAFTSVFAPFHEIKPAEFRRVTEVSYLGFVYGTMPTPRSCGSPTTPAWSAPPPQQPPGPPGWPPRSPGGAGGDRPLAERSMTPRL